MALSVCKRCFNLVLLILCLQSMIHPADSHEKRGGKQNWLNHGGDIYNRRYAKNEIKISRKTVSQLKLKWKFFTGSNVSATPAIYDGVVYFPSWNGYVYAVNAFDGSQVWNKSVHDLLGPELSTNTSLSRSTPTIAGPDLLIIGIYGPAFVVAVRRSSGKLVWSTRLDAHPKSLITMSGTYFKGILINLHIKGIVIGTSSLEETSSIEQCCTFRGSFLKLNAKTGKIIWRTYMLPDNFGNHGEYAGAAIWGSSPSIDSSRNHVYIATGNMYSAPPRIEECQEKQNNQTTPPTDPDACIEPENHSNSILALDLDNGEIKWYKQLGGYDLWFFACIDPSTPGCPPGPNPDADFSAAPMMLSVHVNGTKKDIVSAVQKSGFAWSLDRDTGDILWFTEAGPGGFGGGGFWGAATEGRRVYTNINNSERKNFTLKPSNVSVISGGWVAMDGADGRIIWSTGDPVNWSASGPVTIANGVLFGGSTSPTGPFYAMDARNGKILWTFNTGATIFGEASVSDGCVYVGNGYRFFSPGTSLFAFCIS
ncbi:uncharacterized protein [Euphorbia lathyris]|uniref:uncharacterized protein n=1 Tax=Euphorbia lathyris TaxID=212925 RepID=UPI0033131E6A